MQTTDETTDAPIGGVEIDGRRVQVSVRITFDGIEFVGRLWFADPAAPESAIADRAALPGRTPAEVIALARRLTGTELTQRYRRGWAERRRYGALRAVTGEILARVRRLNRVSTAMRVGLMDTEAAAREIAVTETDLHDLVDRLRDVAGVENTGDVENTGEGEDSR